LGFLILSQIQPLALPQVMARSDRRCLRLRTAGPACATEPNTLPVLSNALANGFADTLALAPGRRGEILEAGSVSCKAGMGQRPLSPHSGL